MALSEPGRVPPPVAICECVTRSFSTRGESVVALDSVTLDVPSNGLMAVAGPSGSGKSTLLALLGCLDRATSGSVTLTLPHHGGDATVAVGSLTRRARRRLRRTSLATIVAEPAENLLLDRTGIENIRLAAHQRNADASDAPALARRLGLDSVTERRCATMSGGEQQRVALACALIGRTPLVLADEPTGALDATSATSVIAALAAAADSGAAIVVATHDPNLITAATHVVRLDHGRRTE